MERVKTNKSLTPSERTSLIQQKRETITLPLIHALERLDEITSSTAETKHEQWFQDTYGKLIRTGLENLRNPVKPEDLLSDWQPFKQVKQHSHAVSQCCQLALVLTVKSLRRFIHVLQNLQLF